MAYDEIGKGVDSWDVNSAYGGIEPETDVVQARNVRMGVFCDWRHLATVTTTHLHETLGPRPNE